MEREIKSIYVQIIKDARDEGSLVYKTRDKIGANNFLITALQSSPLNLESCSLILF
jgi:hypothetical protein